MISLCLDCFVLVDDSVEQKPVDKVEPKFKVGDWIRIDEPDKYAGATGQIQSLMYHREDDAAYFNVFIQGRFGYVSRDVCSDDIRPIPLTPEILEKNGFSNNYAEDDLSYAKDFGGDVIAVHIYGKYGTMDEVRFDYVHQLQHVLRFCGIEKTIEL